MTDYGARKYKWSARRVGTARGCRRPRSSLPEPGAMQSLRGKGVLVTGASSGIGRAAARAFAREGMRVAITARSVEKLTSLSTELGGDVTVLPADLTRPDDVDRVIDAAIARLGRLDVLFANAGIYLAGNVADGNPDEWDKLLALNVGAGFRAIRRVLPHMRENGGG